MHSKLLVICGPTATGKTALAIKLAKRFHGIPISADSRQVYKYMDIGTGKEGHMLGYDLVNPDEEFSVSQYLNFAREKIKEIHSDKRLPILVGGSGLYIKAVVDGIETAEIMPNKILRENLKNRSIEDLFNILKNGDPQRAARMNESDRRNPRRLIRAIEISTQNPHMHFSKAHIPSMDVLFIGLTAPSQSLEKFINKRVNKRVKSGFDKEIDFLKENNFWEHIPQTTLGYKNWPDIDKWKKEELKYAKRQLTWFKKDKRIYWFDVTKPDFERKVEILVQKWYNKVINAKKD